jgi:hypothetical protein
MVFRRGASMTERRIVIVVLVSAVLLAITGCGSGRDSTTTTTPPEGHRIKGTLTLNGTLDEDFIDLDADPFDESSNDGSYPEGHSCGGTGGYDDIQAGLQVTVKNENGTVIGAGEFGSGTITMDGPCEFHFAVPNVPKAAFYQIEAGRRGTLRYSFAQMQGNNWMVNFTLG